MARLNTVEKARKAQGKCGRPGCDVMIEAGDSYFHWANFRQRKQIRCKDHRPRQSEMEGSDKIARLRAAQEALDDALETWDGKSAADLAGAVADAVSVAREVQDEYEEALDAWEHGNEMLQEKVDAVEAWADELENAATDLENLEPDLDDTLDVDEHEDAMQAFREEAAGIVENARDVLEL